jgi:hypothetical protein
MEEKMGEKSVEFKTPLSRPATESAAWTKELA